jgi:hypothetical protein
MQCNELQALLDEAQEALAARDNTIQELRCELAAAAATATTATMDAAATKAKFDELKNLMHSAMASSSTVLTAGTATGAAAAEQLGHYARVLLLEDELSDARTAVTAATAATTAAMQRCDALELQLSTCAESNTQVVSQLQLEVRTLRASVTRSASAIVVSDTLLHIYYSTCEMLP